MIYVFYSKYFLINNFSYNVTVGIVMLLAVVKIIFTS